MKRVAVVPLTLLLVSCNRQPQKLDQSPTPVHVSAVEMFTPRGGDRYSASMWPYRQVTLAFRVSGFVEAIHQVRGADGQTRSIDIGDVVEQGTVLARVRTKDYELPVAQTTSQVTQARETEQTARAQLSQAQAAAMKAAQDYERATALFGDKALTKPDYDAAKAQFDSTRAQVESAQSQIQVAAAAVKTAEAALGSANLGLLDTSLVAPFTAAVVQRSVELGGLASPAASAFVLADVNSIKASFGVPDSVVIQLKPGARLSVFADVLPQRAFEGIVDSIAAVADSSTRLFQVEVRIPNQGSLLRPGMVASLSLGSQAKPQPVAVVPLNAVIRAKEGNLAFAVFVVEGKQAKRKTVTLGATYGDRIAVSGVKPGEQVISTGATLVNDGELVEVIP